MKKLVKNPWAGILLLFIIALFVASLLWSIRLVSPFGSQSPAPVIAEIYQKGELLYRIDLSQVTESYTLRLSTESGATNSILVEPGCIGMLEADCPDKLCVKQGFYSSPSLPITCLPNGVVIQLRQSTDRASNITIHPEQEHNITPDIITY